MTDERLLELFDEFKSAFDAGAAPDVRRYLDRAGQNSGALLLMIDRYMASVPMPALNEDALERAMQDTDAIQRLFRALPLRRPRRRRCLGRALGEARRAIQGVGRCGCRCAPQRSRRHP